MSQGKAGKNLKRWQAVCVNGLGNGADIGSAERGFLESMSERFDKYAEEAYVSDNQEGWFERIEAKLIQQLGAEYIE